MSAEFDFAAPAASFYPAERCREIRVVLSTSTAYACFASSVQVARRAFGGRICAKAMRSGPGKIVEIAVRGHARVEFSIHALDRMKQRGISQAQVIDVLQNPTDMGLQTAPARKRWRGAETRATAVDVVHISKGDTLVVVTVIGIRKSG